MTRPTGRPRGRPKTRDYVTLMARVDVVLADQVKRYASLHRQPISLVIRDALSLLMEEYPEEYPAEANPTGSHRLAAHEFLSDRYESPLDTLVGETDSAALEGLLSDRNKAAIRITDADADSDREYLSDTNEDNDMLSDANRDNDIMSDTKGDEVIMSDTKAVPAHIMSDTNTSLPATTSPPRRKGGRAPGVMRQRILTLLAAHTEGMTAEGIRAALDLEPGQAIGDTLQGMRRSGVVTIQGKRYFLAGAARA